MQKISHEEFQEWKEGYITKKLFNYFKQEEHFQRSHAALGGCSKDSFAGSGEEYIKTMVRAEFCVAVQDLEFEDIIPEEERNESKTKDVPPDDKAGPS